ncbi:MAG: mitochondrial fission ELM1 family protein [Candidatus Omnitrophica bacterium]|nr:mitochondrial fission ELM1 family protein [Candidatus Omnitrophota bacterium]
MARSIGLVGYYLLGKKRAVVEANLRIALSTIKSPQEIRPLVKNVFQNFVCSFVDLLCVPKIKSRGFEKFVTCQGWENITQALSLGRGCILLAVHSGSWELASLVGSMCGHPYNVVVNDQPKASKLNELLNEYRRLAGAKVIYPGSAIREIMRVLKDNEIVTLVLDQGGKDGIPVEFLGKTASMSTGAIRLGLKYQIPVCPVWIERQSEGRHVLKFFSALTLQTGSPMEEDVRVNTQKAVRFFENFLREHPAEYMWFYKVYKYTTQADVLILDDGKTGHLRQSQAVAEVLKTALNRAGKQVRLKTVTIEFIHPLNQKIFVVYCLAAQILTFLRQEEILRFFLKPDCYKALMATRANYIISCGSQTAGINFIMAPLGGVKSIHILKPGLLDWSWFSLIVLPEHDKAHSKSHPRLVFTKVALNLISPDYLKQQQEKLLLRYSHLKTSVRSKMGVLLGGNAKGVLYNVNQLRLLIRQLKEAAQHFNMDLLVTTSRRTPPQVDEMIIKELRRFERCPFLVIANESNVPEALGGILALSDLLIVSGESISMVSEAIASGKKTIVFAPNGTYAPRPSNKYDRFVLELNQQGYLLASSIKDISNSISQVMRQKISPKTMDDQTNILQAIEAIV